MKKNYFAGIIALIICMLAVIPATAEISARNTEENGKLVPDDFRHEHYLLIEENAKRVLISGCSHKGIINIESWFKPDCLVGGFHFSKIEDDNRLKAFAQALNVYDTVFYTCHCTGLRQYGVMKKYMDSLNYISAGDTVVV